MISSIATPIEFERETDLHAGYNIYRVFNLKTPPREIGLIAGDVIHNLRSSL